MPTKITQVEDTKRSRTVLRVEGELFREDALLLQKISRQINKETGHNVSIDIADLALLDSESASVLREMEREGFKLEGMEIFLQKTVDDSEK